MHGCLYPLSSKSRVSTNRPPESIRGNLIRIVRGNSEGYGTVRDGSGHFLTCVVVTRKCQPLLVYFQEETTENSNENTSASANNYEIINLCM